MTVISRRGNASARDVQPVSARRRTESIAKPASKVAGFAEPAIPGNFGNSMPVEALVAQQPLRPVEPAGKQFPAKGSARGCEQHVDVTTRQTDRGGDHRRIEITF